MSGGVDSAVAAALARDAGHEVVGVHMALLRSRQQFRSGSRGCCSIEDALDARRAADILGIPFYVWDLSETFQQTVVADFLNEYAAGRTPNPCVRCNQHVKFDTLAARADALGFDAVVTGHYARIVDGGLHRAANAAKDQSYVLAVMGPQKLAKTLFPLGEFETKADVRAVAERLGLPMATKADSYDICFIPDGNTASFLRERLGERPGPIVDTTGNQLGEHNGAYAYTVGQRKGLALGRPAPDGRPRYVIEVDPRANKVVVGSREQLAVNRLDCDDAVWYEQVSAADPGLTVQVRAHGEAVPARIVEPAETSATTGAQLSLALLNQPLSGVAAGQSAVLYRGTQVIAHARIAKASQQSKPR